MMDSQVNFIKNKRLFCLVTGASRGIGKEIALRLASEMALDDSTFLLVARNGDDLEKTKSEIFSTIADYCGENDRPKKKLYVEVLAIDLADLEHKAEEVKDKLQVLFSRQNDRQKFDRAVLIHNAGTLGPVDRPVQNFLSFPEIRRYMDLNFTSLVLLNNLFLNFLDFTPECQKILVNMTSLAAVSGLPGFGLYSAGKAAREGFMRSLAADDPSVRVLNYSPGPVATDMFDQLCHETWHEETRRHCKEFGDHFQVINCRETVSKLLRILDDNRYENGSRIDFFDEENKE